MTLPRILTTHSSPAACLTLVMLHTSSLAGDFQTAMRPALSLMVDTEIETLEPSAKLTQAGDKLTGVLIMGERERPISEGTIKDGEVNFKVVSKRDDRRFVSILLFQHHRT